MTLGYFLKDHFLSKNCLGYFLPNFEGLFISASGNTGGVGQVVSVLAFNSKDPSSNSAEVDNFYCVKIA